MFEEKLRAGQHQMEAAGRVQRPTERPIDRRYSRGDESTLPWPTIRATAERFNRVLGMTCHAVYHAGQVQRKKDYENQQGDGRSLMGLGAPHIRVVSDVRESIQSSEQSVSRRIYGRVPSDLFEEIPDAR